MKKIILRRTSRILSGHLWIFSNELSTSPKNYEPGSLVEVYDNKNKFIGMEYRFQSRDHPILLSMSETEYLKCAFLKL